MKSNKRIWPGKHYSLVIYLLAAVFLSSMSHSGFATEPETTAIHNSMAYGKLIELNKFSPQVEKPLLLRLYETPKADENCGLESGAVCKYQHVLTVATFDEYPEVKIQCINLEGEFIQAEWVAIPQKADEALIKITYAVFSSTARKVNPKLKNQRKTLDLQVNTKEIAAVNEGRVQQ